MMPDQPLAKKIEATKASYFEKARETSGKLLGQAVETVKPGSGSIAVLNTLSWQRTGLVTLPPSMTALQGVVTQKLATGETVFLATDVPALGAKTDGTDRTDRNARTDLKVTGTTLENDLIKVALDPKTGDLASFVDKRSSHGFVSPSSSYGMNSYRYLLGGNAPASATGTSNVRIAVKENGPVVASLVVESKADGCTKLTREIRLLAGQPQVEILNTLDKIATRVKEGVHFGFAFNLPADATTRMDIPWGVMNPLTDPLPGANKNWLAFQRWIDVSGDTNGVTWIGIEPGWSSSATSPPTSLAAAARGASSWGTRAPSSPGR